MLNGNFMLFIVGCAFVTATSFVPSKRTNSTIVLHVQEVSDEIKNGIALREESPRTLPQSLPVHWQEFTRRPWRRPRWLSKMQMHALLAVLAVYAVFLTLPLLCSVPYKLGVINRKSRKPLDSRRALHLLDEDGDFFLSKWQCFEDVDTACYAFWLLPLRAMDSYVTAGVKLTSSWYNVLLLWLLSFPMLCCCFTLWLTSKRLSLRVALGSRRERRHFVLADVCFVFCCPFCAVVQEARTIDAAVGMKTVCCFTVEELNDPVGAPLLISPRDPKWEKSARMVR